MKATTDGSLPLNGWLFDGAAALLVDFRERVGTLKTKSKTEVSHRNSIRTGIGRDGAYSLDSRNSDDSRDYIWQARSSW